MTSLLPAGLQPTSLLGGGDGGVQANRPAAVAVDLPATDFFLPDLGPCTHQPVLLILLFDNSPSVTGGSDAVGNRFGEAAIALAHCQRRCRCGRELVAVRTFDRHTSSDVGPVQLAGAGWPEVARALTPPPEVDKGSSKLRPALRDAEGLAREHPDHEAVLVVFSDFRLFDLLPDLVLGRLCRFPGRVHAVVLASEPPPLLVDGPVTVRRITPDSAPGDVARAVVAALDDLPASEPLR